MTDVWDQVVQSALTAPKPATDKPPAKLSVRPWPARIDDETPRDVAKIDPKLRDLFRGLIRGELPWPLYLTGEPGTGKSAAVLCLADFVIDSVYLRFTRFLRGFQWAGNNDGLPLDEWVLRANVGDESDRNKPEKWHRVRRWLKESQYWQKLKAAPLVIVDDVATRGGYTEPQYDNFLDLVEDRKMKPFVIVSNVKLAEFGKVFDDRIVSRLARGTRFTLTGNDRRLEGR